MSDYKVLIIEDDEDHRFIMEELIRDAGFTNLEFAVNGKSGLEKIKSCQPQIVLTDTNLGDMNGLNVCKIIKEQHPEIKVVVTTGDSRHVNFPKSKEVGADEYTIKTGNCAEIIFSLKRCAAQLKKKNQDTS